MSALAYKDSEGDVWTRDSNGLYHFSVYAPRSLTELEYEYGPLTPVNDPDTDCPIPPPDPEETPAMTREEALAKATEHVNALSTNGRGYQDGVRFADKVDAVERLARFLAGDSRQEA